MLAPLIGIWFLHIAALLSPGANVLVVSQLAASDRVGSAAIAAFGVTMGVAIWATSAVLGVHAFFHAFPALRLALQVAGALYLLYIASRLWRANTAPLSGSATSVSAFGAFRLGLLTCITNPKSALFLPPRFQPNPASSFNPQRSSWSF